MLARRSTRDVVRLEKEWNAGDLDGYLEIDADDVRLHGFGPEPLDKDGGRASPLAAGPA